MKTSDDGFVTFYPDTHEYFDAYGNKFESVTTALKRHFPFPSHEIAEKVREMPGSRYFGWTVERILSFWDSTAPYGTELHEACEHWINTLEIRGEHRYAVEQFAEFMNENTDVKSVRSEIILYDETIFLAGTADILEFHPDHIDLWDIKTSGKIDDEKLLKFSLQLELYRRLAQRLYNLPVMTRGIIWFPNYIENQRANPQILDTFNVAREADNFIESRRVA